MVKKSEGILLYYIDKEEIKVFLAHPGGPYFVTKDEWGVPKGELDDYKGDNGDLFNVAMREFEEETGIKLDPNKDLIDLGFVKRKDGKEVFVWAVKGNGNERFIGSNEFEMEWPKGTGKMQKFLEIDKAKYFSIDIARKKMHPYQIALIDRLESKLKDKGFKEIKQDKLF